METLITLLQKFLDKISALLPFDPLGGKADVLAKLNPDRFYLENVRAVLGVSKITAQIICDTAVRRGTFSQYVGVLCPDQNIGASAENEAELPAFVRCIVERDGQYEEEELPTSELARITFYKFNASAESH